MLRDYLVDYGKPEGLSRAPLRKFQAKVFIEHHGEALKRLKSAPLDGQG